MRSGMIKGILIALLCLIVWPAASANAILYPLHPGFPKEVRGRLRAAPIVADLDNNGSRELIVATYQGLIYAWGANGALRPGFPINVGGIISGEIAVADLNRNGNREIVAGVGSTTPGIPGRVGVWQANGAMLPGWPRTVTLFNKSETSEISSIALADLDRNGYQEIIAGTDNNLVGTLAPEGTNVANLFAWHHTGQPVAGIWPARDGPSLKGTVAVADLNRDGRPDVVTGRDYQFLFAYNNQGNFLPGWPVQTLVNPGGNKDTTPRITHKRSMPTLADLDRDGTVEIIVAGVRKMPGADDAHNTDLLVLEPNGTRRSGWATPAGGVGFLGADADMDQAPAIADLDGNGRLDIVVPTQDGWIRAYRPDKTLLWQFNYAQGQWIYSSEPVIGDVDNDGRFEVLFGTYDPNNGSAGPVGLWILEHDGKVKAGAPLSVQAPGIMAAPTLADLNMDTRLDIVAVSRAGMVYVWNTGAPILPNRLPWPVARQNNRRTAYVAPPVVSAAQALPPATDTEQVPINDGAIAAPSTNYLPIISR
jgi:hypothetical protein